MQRSSRKFLEPSGTFLKSPKDEQHFSDRISNRNEMEDFSQVTEQLKIAIFSKYFSKYLTEKVEQVKTVLFSSSRKTFFCFFLSLKRLFDQDVEFV